MKIAYAQSPLPKSIFLAGPTPRDKSVPSWRPEAIEILRRLEFDGTVLVPEMESGGLLPDTYDRQIQWEWEALAQATVIVFWVPRELEKLPAFTTNVEFGLEVASSRVLLGFPHDAAKMRYLDRLAQRYQVPRYPRLEALLTAAVQKAADPYPIGGADLAF